jgi:uncharacterized protein YabN with tetrapyrrole methylase and pyrophosphatase domain
MPERSPTPAPTSTLAIALAAFDLQPHEIQAFDPAYPRFDAQRPLLVLAPQFAAAREPLAGRYPADTVARALTDDGVSDVPLSALDEAARHAVAWLLPALPPERDHRALAGLRGVMERLYAPDGCPWDREQTHETLRPYLLEETYELVDAIDRGDHADLEEELGDVFAHLFMQTTLAQLAGEFTVEDVVEHAVAKFVRRHPHVFGDEVADSQEALLARWAQIKESERAERAATTDEPVAGELDSVPRAAPALQRAQAMLRRVRRSAPGFLSPTDAPAAAGAFVAAPDDATLAALLWAVADAADAAGIDAEETLRLAANGFAERFARHEQAAR